MRSGAGHSRSSQLGRGEAEDSAHAAAEDRPEPIRPRMKPKRKPLPDHLPRQEIVHQPQMSLFLSQRSEGSPAIGRVATRGRPDAYLPSDNDDECEHAVFDPMPRSELTL